MLELIFFLDGSFLYYIRLCDGVMPPNRILSKKDIHYNEKDSTVLVRQILRVAAECHLHGLVHLDMKPENFLFESAKSDSSLKPTYFGLSDFIKPEVLNVGPDVNLMHGVSACLPVLCWRRPFWVRTEDGICKEIRRKCRSGSS